jgi:Cu(I)/Ag(I) efflux system membrane fusion protein
VTVLHVHQGGYISPRHDLMEIANLDRVWANVAVYSSQLPWVHVGDRVRLVLPAFPGRTWMGRLRFLYPTLNSKSRTVTARLSFPAGHGLLRPGMYAEATLIAKAAKTLAVPASAVLRSHEGDFVIIGRSEGHFLPVQVRLGAESRGWIAITRGLKSGQAVVDNAQFLLYSESQFQSVKARMLPAVRSGQAGHKGPQGAAGTSYRPALQKPGSPANPKAMSGMVMGPGGGHD